MTISHQINPVFFNPARLSTTSCQCMTNYNPAIINPVWFDYMSPALYMDNPMSSITRCGFIINQHNTEGVISTQDWDYHPYYKKLVKQWCYSMSQVWYISYLIILKCSLGYKPGLYVGHYDPSGGKPPGHFKLVVCRNRLNKSPVFINPAWLSTISR